MQQQDHIGVHPLAASRGTQQVTVTQHDVTDDEQEQDVRDDVLDTDQLFLNNFLSEASKEFNQANYQRALEQYDRALLFLQNQSNKNWESQRQASKGIEKVITIRSNIAVIRFHKKEHEQALKYLEETLALLKENQSRISPELYRPLLIRVLSNLTVIHISLHQNDLSEARNDEILKIINSM